MNIQLSPQDECLRELNWYVTTDGYLRRNYVVDGKRKHELLHRVVIAAKSDQVVDHINGNKFDNRRENLRACTHQENMQNRKRHSNNSTNAKGVYPKREKYCAQVRAGGKKHHLGTFATVVEASAAYESAARQLHGSYFRLN